MGQNRGATGTGVACLSTSLGERHRIGITNLDCSALVWKYLGDTVLAITAQGQGPRELT